MGHFKDRGLCVKLTCVTATFNCVKDGNRERLIRCVESVAALKMPHEHLIYDGASSDGTVKLLRELEQRTPTLHVASEPDTGIYNALNKGVRDAKGEWFYVLGCDDYISHPKVLDDNLEKAKKYDIIVTPVERDNGKREFYWCYQDMKGLFRRNPCSHQGLVVKTSVMRNLGGFNETYKFAADYDMQIQAQFANLPHLYLEEPFAFFAAGGTSFSNIDRTNAEIDSIAMDKLRLSERALQCYRRRGFMPIRTMTGLMMHRNPLLRAIGKQMWLSLIKTAIHVAFSPVSVVRNRIRSR